MDLDNFEQRYEEISPDEARELWGTEYRLCASMCTHGPNCKNRAMCVVGKRMQERALLTADDCLSRWGELEAVLGRRKAKVMRVVLGGRQEGASQGTQGSQVPVRRFIGVEVFCSTGDEFGPDLRAPCAPPAHAREMQSLVEEMDADSGVG